MVVEVMSKIAPLSDEELEDWRQLLAVETGDGPKAEYLKFHRRVLATIDRLKANQRTPGTVEVPDEWLRALLARYPELAVTVSRE